MSVDAIDVANCNWASKIAIAEINIGTVNAKSLVRRSAREANATGRLRDDLRKGNTKESNRIRINDATGSSPSGDSSKLAVESISCLSAVWQTYGLNVDTERDGAN